MLNAKYMGGHWKIIVLNAALWSLLIARGGLAESIRTPDGETDSPQHFFPSVRAELAGKEKALSSALTQTLEQLPGVRKVRVHISLVPEGIWKAESLKSSASVVVFSEQPSVIPVSSIRSIVAGACSQLAKSQVVVEVFPVVPVMSDDEMKSADEKKSKNNERILMAIPVVGVMLGALGMIVLGVHRRKKRWNG